MKKAIKLVLGLFFVILAISVISTSDIQEMELIFLVLFFFFLIILVIAIVLYGLWSLLVKLFKPRMVTIKGEIIRFKVKKYAYILDTSQLSGSTDTIPWGDSNISVTQPSVFFQDDKNGKKYYIDIPLEPYQKLRKLKPLGCTKVILYFKRYLWCEDCFNRFEIELFPA